MDEVTAECGNEAEEEGMLGDDEAFQLPFAANFYAMALARHARRSSCCPQLFERASKSWWNPKFDSDIFESQYICSSLPKLTIRFRFALFYILLSSITWSAYWIYASVPSCTKCIAVSVFVGFAAAAGLVYARFQHYQNHQMLMSCITSFMLIITTLLPFLFHVSSLDAIRSPSPSAIFSFYVEALLLIYTMLPLPLYLVFIFNTSFTFIFEVFSVVLLKDTEPAYIAIRIVMHTCLHLIGFHIMIMNEVRMRGTFMSVGQSLQVRRQLEYEKALKEQMILSVMPPKVADWLMKEAHSEDVDDFSTYTEEGAIIRKASSPRSSNAGGDLKFDRFRPFNMNVMDNVSILFADIVGFTRMSSNKTAEHLVGLLNDLFGRFDDLCVLHGCEKISTLGDCYYAVSGCPLPRPDHASCCVNMGLSMVDAIKEFDAETNEDVDMRVGVHTGKVLCGIVGTMRFKFDVWSKDVTLANQMESTGRPGYVHISEVTENFLPIDTYAMESGPDVSDNGMKTYFISEKLLPEETLQVKFSPMLSLSPAETRNPSPQKSPADQKAASLPNMLDCVLEADSKGRVTNKPTMDTSGVLVGKMRHSFAPGVDALRIRLPRFSRADRTKAKTTSLPKISNRVETPIEKQNTQLSHSSNGNGRTTSSSWPPVASPPLNSSSPSTPAPPPPSPHSPSSHAAPQILDNSAKDPRKDSGIRSRRSSIQDEIFSMNGLTTGDLLTHRLSDYATSSQPSLNEIKFVEEKSPTLRDKSTMSHCEKRFLQMRKQSDIQMIKCMKQETIQRPYVMVTRLSHLTLFFLDADLEKTYRLMAHSPRKDEARTLSSTLFNTYCDVLIATILYFGISFSLFLLYPISLVWTLVFTASFSWHLVLIWLCLNKIMGPDRYTNVKSRTTRLYDYLMQWTPCHLMGASLLCLPFLASFTNFSCKYSLDAETLRFFCFIFVICVVCFCNFTQLNCWLKSLLASANTIIGIGLIVAPICPYSTLESEKNNATVSTDGRFSVMNLLLSSGEFATDKNSSHQWLGLEIVVNFCMLLVLVWVLNREFEISYRLSFYGYFMAMKDKARVQSMKNQAEWLLHNIIPKHVTNVIKSTAKYSENHKKVGVMFASIFNFNELYNEDYMGGKEYLRILNELVADFDELLTKDEFRNIEKIKTIGSTYMAAAGLNKHRRNANEELDQHLFELVEFARDMLRVIENFNQNLIGFNLMLRIGINFGDVTAGVIGTTKLFYDIWGDAVNISSRMDSTGVANRIQVSEEWKELLSRKYTLEPRGQVFVKGKDNMNVFLLKFHDN